MRERNTWRWIALPALGILLLIGLLIVGIQDRASKRERALILEQAEPLEKQRDELIARRDRLERAFYEQHLGQATEQLLFLELDGRLTEEVFPTLQERQITGVLGLYEGNFPGDEGRIGREELQSLLQAGWELCLVYQGEAGFSDWDRAMTLRLQQEGLPKPDTLYFPERTYDPALEEEILQCGYRTVIHHGENRMSLITGNVTEGLWFVGARPWNFTGVKDNLEELARLRGEQCYTLRFTPGREEYENNAFVNMLDFVEPMRRDGSLEITGFARARELHDPEKNGANAAREAWLREDQELREQILDLNRQLQLVYEQWKGGNDD